jgi:hypothetical protein
MNNINGNGFESYNDRQNHINIAELLFVKWAEEKNYKINRIGFDEKNNSVNDFFKLNPILRNLPDFVISKDDKCFIINVKGTANIKKKEYDLIPKFIECFSSDKCPLIYAFCFQNKTPIFKKANDIIKLFENSTDKIWNDGVIYRNIYLK